MSIKLNDMTAGKPIKLIFKFALPLMIGNLFQQAYTMVDSIIVGQGVGVSALAALGAGDWLNWMMIGVITGITQGFSILYARHFGAKDEKKLRESIANSIFVALGVALILTFGSLSITKPLLVLLKTDPSIINISYSYLVIMFSGLTIVMAYNFAASILRSLGNGHDPLVAMIIASILNIGLDLLFVMGFHWGVQGAAIATLLAQCFAFFYCLRSLCKIPMLHLHKEDFMIQNHLIFRLMKLGFPLAFMNIIIAIGGLVVQSVVNVYGISFVAGFTVTNKLYGLLEVAATSFGFSIATYVGQNSGAKNTARIKEGMKSAVMMALLTSLTISVVMLIFGRAVISVFIDSTASNKLEVIDIAYRYLSMMCYFLWVLYLLHVFRSALQGLSDTITPLITSIAELVMRVGSVLILPLFIGSEGVFYSEILAWIGSVLILITVFTIRIRKLA